MLPAAHRRFTGERNEPDRHTVLLTSGRFARFRPSLAPDDTLETGLG
jgi:hypothetical protein